MRSGFALPLLALLCACSATSQPNRPSDADEAVLPPIPFCRDEMAAYVELARFARGHGEGWVVFAPALDALQQRIIDCVDDSAARLHQLKLQRPAEPPAPRPDGGAGTSPPSPKGPRPFSS